MSFFKKEFFLFFKKILMSEKIFNYLYIKGLRKFPVLLLNIKILDILDIYSLTEQNFSKFPKFTNLNWS